MGRRGSAIGGLFAVLGAACSATPSASVQSAPAPPAPPSAAPVVYAAIGASETAGVGADDPRTQAWPTVFFQRYLPTTATYYNFGIGGEKIAGALNDELPQALAVHPNIVTVWLNVNDIIAGVSPDQYSAMLTEMIQPLRAGGAHVLVANTPYLDQLPAYLSCRKQKTSPCGNVGDLSPAQLDELTDAYNAAVAQVAQAEGATLVDLHSIGEMPLLHPTWISSDGFHPSTEGYTQIATRFGAAYSGSTG